ncbi:MAG TPA: SPOR domain-containing protein [Azospirillum sp.]|nr:SPOR domain-containing protein [Azospirillum sp.]
MGLKLTVGLAAAASIALAGCAGIPVAVSAASFYVDTVLFLRTNKTSVDHVISAVAERDCAMTSILVNGRLCDDASSPELLAELTREVENVPPGGNAEIRIEVAEAQPLVLSDTVPAPGAAPLPAPAEPVRTRVLVVVGSFTKRAHAEARRAIIAHPSTSIVEATVSGRRYYRVVITPADREDALRQLSVVRDGGIKDAWLLRM